MECYIGRGKDPRRRDRRILIAEDSAVSRFVLSATLAKWGFQVVAVADGEGDVAELLKPDAPLLAVIDWMMPGKDGLDVSREIRARKKEPYTYIILLSARGDRKDLIEGMKAGADDYISKPFDAQELKVRLRAGSRIIELQEQLIEAREELRQQALHDGLTGLLNRSAILENLRREMARCGREGRGFGLILADLDHFKRVNDRLGHLAGDAVLKEVARRMKRSTRSYDAVGRFGGEDFLIVLAGADPSSTLKVAERLREHVKAQPVMTPEGPLGITLSAGVATWSSGEAADVKRLIRHADKGLYEAKRVGRDRVCVTGARLVAMPVRAREKAVGEA